MKKAFVTYFFSLILMVTYVVPTYQALFDGTCEISLISDMNDEEEQNKEGKESAEDKELNILYNSGITSFFEQIEEHKRASYFSKNYTSYFKRLTSPPPEQLS